MIPNADNENLIRRYLLGDLGPEDLTRVEILLLEDAEFAAQVQLVECELLEEYLEGTLTAAEHSQCETHFLSVPARQRQLAVAKAVRRYAAQASGVTLVTNLNQSAPPHPAVSKGWWRVLFSFEGTRGWQLAVAAMLVGALGWGAWRIWLAPSQVERGLRVLHQAYNRQRLVEVRITGFGHAPLSLTRGAAPTIIDNRARELAEKQFLEAIVERSDATAYHALGRAYLAKQEFDKAIEQFETALKLTPDVATLHSDLGAALVEKIRSEGAESASRNQPELIERAFRELDRAAALNEHLLEPLFNRALLYQALHLNEPAQQSWQKYLLKDRASPWAVEAKRNLEAFPKKSGKVAVEPDNLYTQFLQACQVQEKEKSLQVYRQSYLRHGNYITTKLADNFLDVSARGQTAAAQVLLGHFRYLGSLTAQRDGDHFNEALAKAYASATPRQLLLAEQGRSLRQQAYRLSSKAQHDQALAQCQTARDFFVQAGFMPEVLVTEFWIAECYLRLSEHQQSLSVLERVAAHCQRESYLWWRAMSFNKLANVESDREKFSLAVNHCLEAKQMFKRLGDESGELRALITLAGLYRETGRFSTSIWEAQRALQLADRLAVDDSWVITPYAISAGSLGNLELHTTALEFQQEAVRIAEKLQHPQAISRYYVQLGLLYEKTQNLTAATNAIKKGLSVGENLHQSATERDIRSYALLHLGRMQRKAGNYQEALHTIEQPAQFYQAKGGEAYSYLLAKEKLLIQIALGNIPTAQQELTRVLNQFEANRKNVLRVSLRNSFFDAQQSIYDVAIGFAHATLNQPEQAFDYSELSRARSLLDTASAAYGATDDAGIPDLIVSRSTQPLTLTEIKQSLPPQTQLLQFAVLDDRLVIWLVTGNQMQTRVVQLGVRELSDKVKLYLRWLARPATNEITPEARSLGAELYGLLIAPVEASLQRDQSLCIVPDKILNFLPFAALYDPAKARYLLEDFVLLSAPSATLFIREVEVAKLKTPKVQERLLCVGNPTFDRRLLPDLPLLPSAAQEAETVASLYDKATLLTGKAAGKEALLAEIGNAEIIHLAMHYVADDRSSMLSRLVLAATAETAEPSGAEQNSLAMYEVYRLKLARAKLVVLSACQTGIEEYYKGEGAIGLARPFAAAGAPLVVASLWPVDSQATSELMVKFHELRRRQHYTTPAALRAAQTMLLYHTEKRFRHPYYWAAFTAIGGYGQY